MVLLVLGIVIFLGTHSVRIAAPEWRDGVLAMRGEGLYKGLYSLASLAGLVLIAVGFAMTRAEPVVVYVPPDWGRHVAMGLMLPAFISLAASGSRVGRIKALVRHPMLVGVMLWAGAHLVANGDLASVILFGSFLIWAVADRISVAGREADAARAPGEAFDSRADLVAIVVGAVLYGLFVWRLHAWLFGVSPIA